MLTLVLSIHVLLHIPASEVLCKCKADVGRSAHDTECSWHTQGRWHPHREFTISPVFCPPPAQILIQLNHADLPASDAGQPPSCPGDFALLPFTDNPYPARAQCIHYVRCLLKPLSLRALLPHSLKSCSLLSYPDLFVFLDMESERVDCLGLFAVSLTPRCYVASHSRLS